FDSLFNIYSKYPVFELWCGLDLKTISNPDFEKKSVKELERCYKKGARGVGELVYSGDEDTNKVFSWSHPKLIPVLNKCGELKMPVSIHVADPVWSFLSLDHHNEELTENYSAKKNKNFDKYIQDLELVIKRHPNTTFVVCHFANLTHDLGRLTALLKKYPNMYVDISARFFSLSKTPRAALKFFTDCQDQIVYGSDLGNNPTMYQLTYRILETQDENFSAAEYEFKKYTPLYGINTPDLILKKIYYTNAQKILKK
ncbi:MAG TPA: amidohydrolase family protein, partial [Cytophagaceae bacterium]